jgi:hypothetical protein
MGDLMKMASSVMGEMAKQRKAALGLDLETVEGRIRTALIEERTGELVERYKDPTYIRLTTDFASQAMDVLDQKDEERNGPTYTMDDLSEMDSEQVNEVFADSETINLKVGGPSNDDLMGFISQMMSDDTILEMTASGEAANEFSKPADVDQQVEDAVAKLQDAGMATGAIEGVLDDATERRRATREFKEQVIAELVARAEVDGEDAVSNLAAYREVIRSLKSMDEYLELHLEELDGQADELNTVEDAGRINGGKKGQSLEDLAASLTDNGQAERLERLQMWTVLQDAKLIYGE